MSIVYKGFKLNKLALSISEAAELSNLDRAYIRSKIDNGELQTFIPSGRTQRKIPTHILIDFIIDNSYSLKNYSEVI